MDTSSPIVPSAQTLESFLTHFHDTCPGGTSKSLADMPVMCDGKEFNSSYDFLVSEVPNELVCGQFLDIACGDGFLLERLKQARGCEHDFYGADISAGELQLAAARQTGVSRLTVARAQALPFAANRFDYVVCHMALMLMSNVEGVIEEISRVLRPNGTFAAVLGAPAATSGAQQLFLQALSEVPRIEKFRTVSFSANSLRTEAGIKQVLSNSFDLKTLRRLEITLSEPPAAMWDWFAPMYDLALVSEEGRALVRTKFFEGAKRISGPQGKLEHKVVFHYFSATSV